MAPGQLSLFPAPTSHPPRSVPVVKRSEPYADGLQGMTFHVSSLSKARPTVKPATSAKQHAMSSESPITGTVDQLSPFTASSSQSTPDLSTQAESSPKNIAPLATSNGKKPEIQTDFAASFNPVPSTPHQNELSPLPLHPHLPASSSSPQAQPRQPPIPSIITSPLNDKASLSSQSTSQKAPSSLQYDQKSMPTSCTDSPDSKKSPLREEVTVPMRSIFPQYDFNKPLSEQSYYPAARTVPPSSRNGLFPPSENEHMPKHADSAVGLVDGYEHIPAASVQDQRALWDAACGKANKSARKVQFGLYQSEGQGTALAIGLSLQNIAYDLDMDLAVRRYSPSADSATPVAQLSLPEPSQAHFAGNASTEIFPHPAAVNALAETTKALEAEGAGSDPSYVTAQQHKAIANARRRHTCTLVRKTRSRDTFSAAVTASYTLQHPSLGGCAIEVTKSHAAPHTSALGFAPRSHEQAKAKISFHHPSATPAAIEAGTLNLAFLDFARDSCVLDLPGLAALGCAYLVDTVVSALLAVAVIENEALVEESSAMPAFDAPPTTALPSAASRVADKQAKRSFRKNGKKAKAKRTAEFMGEPVELPLLARGTLSVLGFGFKAAIFVLETGLKVATGTVVGLSHVAKKL